MASKSATTLASSPPKSSTVAPTSVWSLLGEQVWRQTEWPYDLVCVVKRKEVLSVVGAQGSVRVKEGKGISETLKVCYNLQEK